jgi:hypothetical protein
MTNPFPENLPSPLRGLAGEGRGGGTPGRRYLWLTPHPALHATISHKARGEERNA